MSSLSWNLILKQNITSLKELISFLELDEEKQSELITNRAFPLSLPKRLAQKIQKNTLDDPILRQFVPLKAELERKESFIKDPVGDCPAARTPKVLHKYEGRVLLLVTGACAMHCRFCFRQKYAYAPFQTGLEEELTYIGSDPTIKEVILSGGDPLSLRNSHIKGVLDSLAAISHIKRIRFHTRFPIGIPERIDNELLTAFETCAKQIWFIIHCNHPQELDDEVVGSLKKIQKLGIPVLNQFVLLRGINDSALVLQTLCEKLIDHGIFPYYMHQLDRVEGAAHFEVDQAKGKELITELNKCLSGYGVPKYVQEIAGEASKTVI